MLPKGEQKLRIACPGSALAYILVIMTVVMIILVSMLGYVVSQLTFSSNRTEKSKSLGVAEAGIYWYRWYLAHETSGKTAQEISNFWENGNPFGVNTPYEADLLDPEGGSFGRYSVEVEPPESGSTIINVKSTGWTFKEPNVKRVVKARFRRPSWSEYAVLANDIMRFGENTEVFGEIHSNFGVRFDGLAHNIISSSVATYDDPDHSGGNEFGVHTHVNPYPQTGVNNSFRSSEAPPTDPVPARNDVFLAGRQFPVPVIDFNGLTSDFNYMKNEAQAGNGMYFNNAKCDNKNNLGRHIILNGTSMTVTTVTQYNNANYSISREGCSANVPIMEGGVYFVENNIWIEGDINGRRVTFVAANLSGGDLANIYIGMDNILYANFDGTDIIGLVAQNDIEVVKNSLDNLTIDAALITQAGRVGRNYYTPWGCNSTSCEDHKGTITINGALATYMRYGFAYTNGTGYANRILNFDNNLLYWPPPYFPTGSEYSIDLWEEL